MLLPHLPDASGNFILNDAVINPIHSIVLYYYCEQSTVYVCLFTKVSLTISLSQNYNFLFLSGHQFCCCYSVTHEI